VGDERARSVDDVLEPEADAVCGNVAAAVNRVRPKVRARPSRRATPTTTASTTHTAPILSLYPSQTDGSFSVAMRWVATQTAARSSID
jgi:hypothetical protein